ncbi:ABC transporter permease, partial [Gordonia aichiensis]
MSEHVVASFDTFGRQLGLFVEVFRTLFVDIAKR